MATGNTNLEAIAAARTGLSEATLENVSKRVVEAVEASKRKGRYCRFTAQQRAEIGHFALQKGTAFTVRVYKKDFPSLSESTVRSFRDKVKRAQQQLGLDSEGKTKEVKAIECKPRGRPLKLMDLDVKVMAYLDAIRESDGVVNCTVVKAVAKALVEAEDSTRLAENGGDLVIEKPWAVSLLRRFKRMKAPKERTTTDPTFRNGGPKPPETQPLDSGADVDDPLPSEGVTADAGGNGTSFGVNIEMIDSSLVKEETVHSATSTGDDDSFVVHIEEPTIFV